MDEVTLEMAPQALRDMFNRGFAAMERGNLDYAIDMFYSCVEKEPMFLQARKFLRAAEVKKHKGGKGGFFAHWASMAVGAPSYLTATAQLKAGKPLDAMRGAEKLLRHDPLNLPFIKLLGQAAELAHAPEIAIQSLAIAREHYPDDPFILNWLGQLYMATDRSSEARECFEALCALQPNDAAALKALKDAMAVHSMSRDGWSATAAAGGSFRNMIKDEKEAELLEQESKAVKAQKDVESLIAEGLAKIQREPGNTNYRRALANLYAGNAMFAEAIQTLEEAQRMAGSRDPQIDNTISAVRIQQYDHDIGQMEAGGNAPGAEALRRDKKAYVFSDIKDRVTRYPNDLQLRYDYAVQLYQRALTNDAIQQFQLAQRNPQRRILSLYHIGLCFKAKKQYDMAIEQLQLAAAEHPAMDDTKKDIFYELGLTLEATGDFPKALEYYKRIYQVDIAYKDIAQKIERGYRT